MEIESARNRFALPRSCILWRTCTRERVTHPTREPLHSDDVQISTRSRACPSLTNRPQPISTFRPSRIPQARVHTIRRRRTPAPAPVDRRLPLRRRHRRRQRAPRWHFSGSCRKWHFSGRCRKWHFSSRCRKRHFSARCRARYSPRRHGDSALRPWPLRQRHGGPTLLRWRGPGTDASAASLLCVAWKGPRTSGLVKPGRRRPGCRLGWQRRGGARGAGRQTAAPRAGARGAAKFRWR